MAAQQPESPKEKRAAAKGWLKEFFIRSIRGRDLSHLTDRYVAECPLETRQKAKPVAANL